MTHSIPPAGVEATFLLITASLALAGFLLGFLAHKTAESQRSWKRALRGVSVAGLALGGLAFALTLAELAFRILVPGGFFQFRPVPGSEEEAIVEHLPDGQAYWEYRNARGFDDRGYRDGYDEPEEDAFRMVVLGDSVTFGVFMEYEDTFVARLEKELRARGCKLALYNLAVPAYSPLQERLALERKGLKVKPNLVFLGVFPNDLAQYTIVGSTAYDIRLKASDGVPIFDELPLPDSLNRFLVLNSVLYQFVTLRGASLLDRATGKETGQLEAALGEIDLIRTLSEGVGSRLVVALFPMLEEEGLPESRNTSVFYGAIRAWAGRTRTPLIDLREPLSGRPLADVRVDDCCHLSQAGHALVTGILLAELDRLGLLPPHCR